MKKYLILYTGGTLGMISHGGGASNEPEVFLKHLQAQLDEEEIVAEIHVFDPLIDSSQLTVEGINEMIRLLITNYGAYDGFLILHGTDTMAYTYSCLKWSLKCFKKPIVLTGAIHTLDRDPEESRINLHDSIKYLKENYLQGNVALIMGGLVIDQGFCSKVSNSSLTPFKVMSNGSDQYRQQKENNQLSYCLYKKSTFEIIHCLPMEQCHPNRTIDDALLLILYGTGTYLNNENLIQRIKVYLDKGVRVLGISQCPGNSVDFSLYEVSQPLLALGVEQGNGMMLEEAFAYLTKDKIISL